MGIKTVSHSPYCPDLAPCDFWLFPRLRGCRYEKIDEMKVLYFDLLTRPKMPFRVTHRKEVTHSNGRYERKSRRRKFADEMGRGKEKSHYTLIDWRTGREWPLNCMTVISARWRLHRPFQRKRKWHIPVARYRKKLRRRVHITAWEFEGNITPTNWGQSNTGEYSWGQAV